MRRPKALMAAILLAVPLGAAGIIVPAHAAATHAAATHAAAGADRRGAVTVNWALSGSATATTAEPSAPAANAADGDAGTDWCTSGWTGTLTVDLGQVRPLTSLGLTMDASSPAAAATIEVARAAGDWLQVPGLHDVALDPGN